MNRLLGAALSLMLFAVAPTSTNYTLKTYDIGSGGGASSSTNYSLQAGTGTQSGSPQSSANYTVNSDGRGVMNANVPPTPTFTNPSDYYNRLKLVIATGNNPTDTKYLIAASTDNFVTTSYVQADDSLGASQAITNYQTYAAWGGASGFYIIGLTPSTTYQVKVKALQGNYTGSGFSLTATAATVATSVSFSLTTTLTTTPPFFVSFMSLTPGSVVDGGADALIGLSSNAFNGGTVYVKDNSNGLFSTLANTTISSATADLSSAASGYGVQVIAVGQTSGGPFSSQSPYNVSANNVGALSSQFQPIFSTNAPVTGANGTVRLKAKATNITPSSSDYSDAVTIMVVMTF
jgi:hypothetical protein